MKEKKKGEILEILTPLDLDSSNMPWGGYARVFSGTIMEKDGKFPVAIKMMRTGSDRKDKSFYLKAFKREVKILNLLGETSSNITKIFDFGVILFEDKLDVNDEMGDVSEMKGIIKHFGEDGLDIFYDWLNDDSVNENIIPYLAMELRRPLEINLYSLIADHVTEDELLPVPAVLMIAQQLVETLHVAHQQGVIYADVKPIHFYISFDNAGAPKLYIIDWNASMILEEMEDEFPDFDHEEWKQKDLKEAAANILFPLFTGRKLANSSNSMGRTQEKVVEHLRLNYDIGEWHSSENKRLNNSIKKILEDTIVSEKIKTSKQFLSRLKFICEEWMCNDSNKSFLVAVESFNKTLRYYDESTSILKTMIDESGLLLEAIIDMCAKEKNIVCRNEAMRLYFALQKKKKIIDQR